MVNVQFRICKYNEVIIEFSTIGSDYSSPRLLCGEFKPSLPGTPRYVHFTTVTYLGDKIKLLPSNRTIKLKEFGNMQSLNIIEPGKFIHVLEKFFIKINATVLVPIPLPDSLNSGLLDLCDFCYAHVFFKEENSGNLTYLSSIGGPWDNYFGSISRMLSEKQRPLFNIKVAIVTEIVSTVPVIPTLAPAETFFITKFSYKKGRKVMIIIVSSNTTCKIISIFACAC